MDVLLTCYIAAKNNFECQQYIKKVDQCIIETINKNKEIDASVAASLNSLDTKLDQNVDHCMEQYKSYLQYYCLRDHNKKSG
jgi:hypothetical protein